MSLIAGLALVQGCSEPSPKQKEYSQIEKANIFVRDLSTVPANSNSRVDNYAVAKGVSVQPGYSVFLNLDTGRYFAVDVRGFYPWNGESARNHLSQQTQDGLVYFNLSTNLDGTFSVVDANGNKGITFSAKDVTGSVSIAQRAAAEARIHTSVAVDNLVTMGLNAKKAESVAGALVALKKNSGDKGADAPAVAKLIAESVGPTAANLFFNSENSNVADLEKALGEAVSSGAVNSPAEAIAVVQRAQKRLNAAIDDDGEQK